MSLARHVLFWGSTSVLFDSEVTKFPDLDENLREFDETFEIAVSPIPQFLVRGFQAAKAALHQKLPQIMKRRAQRDHLDYKVSDAEAADNTYAVAFFLVVDCSLFDLFVSPHRFHVDKGTLAEEILRAFHTSAHEKDPTAPGWLLSTLWAAEANSIPVSFWTIAYLLSHPECLRKAQAEIDCTFELRNCLCCHHLTSSFLLCSIVLV